jgi:hypothetical protein
MGGPSTGVTPIGYFLIMKKSALAVLSAIALFASCSGNNRDNTDASPSGEGSITRSGDAHESSRATDPDRGRTSLGQGDANSDIADGILGGIRQSASSYEITLRIDEDCVHDAVRNIQQADADVIRANGYGDIGISPRGELGLEFYLPSGRNGISLESEEQIFDVMTCVKRYDIVVEDGQVVARPLD